MQFRFFAILSFRQQTRAKFFLIASFSSPLSFTFFDSSHDVQTKSVLSCLVPWSSSRENHVCSSWNTRRTQRFNSRCVLWFPRKTNGYMLQWPECKGEDLLMNYLIDHLDSRTLRKAFNSTSWFFSFLLDLRFCKLSKINFFPGLFLCVNLLSFWLPFYCMLLIPPFSVGHFCPNTTSCTYCFKSLSDIY